MSEFALAMAILALIVSIVNLLNSQKENKMDKDWLIDQINEEAEQCFEKDFESLTTDDSGANQLFSKVKQTEEWSAFQRKNA